MAAATTPADTDRELTRAREPLPVKPTGDRMSSGLDRSIERSIEREDGQKLWGGNDSGKFKAPSVDFSKFQTLLKLRTKVVLRPRLTADLGLDLSPLQQRARPVACLEYELKKDDPDFARLRVTDKRVVIVKSVPVDFNRIKVPLTCSVNAAAGFNWQGIPDVDVNVGDVKPTWVVPVVGLAMLALRQPLSGAKTFGNWEISQPVDAVAAGEVSASLRRDEGCGVTLGVGQINAFLRF